MTTNVPDPTFPDPFNLIGNTIPTWIFNFAHGCADVLWILFWSILRFPLLLIRLPVHFLLVYCWPIIFATIRFVGQYTYDIPYSVIKHYISTVIKSDIPLVGGIAEVFKTCYQFSPLVGACGRPVSLASCSGLILSLGLSVMQVFILALTLVFNTLASIAFPLARIFYLLLRAAVGLVCCIPYHPNAINTHHRHILSCCAVLCIYPSVRLFQASLHQPFSYLSFFPLLPLSSLTSSYPTFLARVESYVLSNSYSSISALDR